MSKVQVTEGLRCELCDHAPFRNRAGLGAHLSAIHHLRLDGTPAKPRKVRSNGNQVIVRIKNRQVTVPMSDDEIRQLLVNHPAAVVDALLAS